MTEQDVIKTIREFAEKQFPKTCSSCGRQYKSLTEYIRDTRPTGQPISYDAEQEDWLPKNPLGTVSMVQCSCGNTLSITSDKMNVITLWHLMHWARKEIKQRGIPLRTLLEELRDKIDQSILGAAGDTNPA